MSLNVLIACEESQAVCIEFRKLGINAYSCDIQECSGNHPEWHFKEDIFKVIEAGNLVTENGENVFIEKWGCMIAFPPCTHLAVSGAKHFEQKRKDGRQQEGIDFFLKIANLDIKHIAIENPVGIMSKIYRKPDQIIQPYYFGDEAQKTTCLWLKNLPKLQHYNNVDLFNTAKTHVKPEFIFAKNGNKYSKIHWLGGGSGKERSKTFPGIAKAIAKQWSEYLINSYQHS
jgi:hypothetical protein